jgi:hypothetical protein
LRRCPSETAPRLPPDQDAAATARLLTATARLLTMTPDLAVVDYPPKTWTVHPSRISVLIPGTGGNPGKASRARTNV